MIAFGETAAIFAKRAARAFEGTMPEKANNRFEPEELAVVSRIFAREAAMKVAQDGLRWIIGADSLTENEIQAFEQKMNFTKVYHAQAGMIDDMNFIKTVLYKED